MNINYVLYGMPWYRLPVSFQMHVYYGIKNVQNAAVLSIGPLAQLDFSTGSDVIFSLSQSFNVRSIHFIVMTSFF